MQSWILHQEPQQCHYTLSRVQFLLNNLCNKQPDKCYLGQGALSAVLCDKCYLGQGALSAVLCDLVLTF